MSHNKQYFVAHIDDDDFVAVKDKILLSGLN